MTNINYDLCNDSSLISQLKLLVNHFLICHLICTHISHVKSCFDSMRFFLVQVYTSIANACFIFVCGSRKRSTDIQCI